MRDDFSEAIPAQHRMAVREALRQVLGPTPVDGIVPLSGGSTGACLCRVDAGDARLLLRIEGPETAMLKRNPHRFAAMQLAAQAGLAPSVHYVDETNGITVTDFIEHKPFESFPGGEAGLAQALGDLFRSLQDGPAFPPLVDYRELLANMLRHLADSGLFTPGLLDPHLAELARICTALDWNPDALVASHNDPNPNNILFDGVRLWLIDWETAYRNHPFVDLAIVSETFAPSPELADGLLRAWSGKEPDAAKRAKLQAVGRLTRLYYACFLLQAGAAAQQAPVADISAPSPAAILLRLNQGDLTRGGAGTLFEFGKVYLHGFLTGTMPPGLREAGAAAF